MEIPYYSCSAIASGSGWKFVDLIVGQEGARGRLWVEEKGEGERGKKVGRGEGKEQRGEER